MDVLTALAGVIAASLVAAAVATTVLVWRLRRRNRVCPGVRSDAPVWWLWSPTRPARLHRRLQTAVAAARFGLGLDRRKGRPGSPMLADLVDDLQSQAAVIDRQVVVAARCPSSVRGRLLRTLSAQVDEVETLVERVLEAASAATGDPPPAALRRIEERLDALDVARDEIAGLEAAAGLRSPDEAMPRRRLASGHDRRVRPDPGGAPEDRLTGDGAG